MLRGLAIRDTNIDRRSTLQHKTRDTNAGGGVRRNTRRVTPTPEEEYVTRRVTPTRRRSMSQDASHQRGGGVCHKTRHTNAEEEYVTTQDAWHQRRRRSTSQHKTRHTNARGGVGCHHSKLISYPRVFFPPKFSYFLYQSFNFFLLLSCVVMTLNISLIRIVYCIQSCMSLMSSLLFTNIIQKKPELICLSLED